MFIDRKVLTDSLSVIIVTAFATSLFVKIACEFLSASWTKIRLTVNTVNCNGCNSQEESYTSETGQVK